jgi:hypothetical protein
MDGGYLAFHVIRQGRMNALTRKMGRGFIVRAHRSARQSLSVAYFLGLRH